MRLLDRMLNLHEPVKSERDLLELIFDIGCDVRTYQHASLRRRLSATRLLRWNIESYFNKDHRFNGAWLRSMITLQNFINGQRCSDADLGLAIRMLPLMGLEIKYTDSYEGCTQLHQEIERQTFSHSM